jgi:hypothetical protein
MGIDEERTHAVAHLADCELSIEGRVAAWDGFADSVRRSPAVVVPGQRVSGPDVSTVDKEQTVHSRTLKPACSGPFRTLDVPGSTETFARGINDPGDVTGRFNDANGAGLGFVRDRHGSFRVISVPGSIFTTTFNITDTGIIAGSDMDANGAFHGYVSVDDHFQTVDYPGAVDTRVRGIDRSEELLGNFGSVAEAVEHGFIKDADGFRQVDVSGIAQHGCLGRRRARSLCG